MRRIWIIGIVFVIVLALSTFIWFDNIREDTPENITAESELDRNTTLMEAAFTKIVEDELSKIPSDGPALTLENVYVSNHHLFEIRKTQGNIEFVTTQKVDEEFVAKTEVIINNIAKEIMNQFPEEYVAPSTSYIYFSIKDINTNVDDTAWVFSQGSVKLKEKIDRDNHEMEAAFRKIVETELSKTNAKKFNLTLDKIFVVDYGDRTQGYILIITSEEVEWEPANEVVRQAEIIVKSIATKIMNQYPEEYNENSDSYLDFSLGISDPYGLGVYGWEISNGKFSTSFIGPPVVFPY